MYMNFELHDDKMTSEFDGTVAQLTVGVALIARAIYAGLDDDDRKLFRDGIIKVFTEHPFAWNVSGIEAEIRAATVKTPVTAAGPLS